MFGLYKSEYKLVKWKKYLYYK